MNKLSKHCALILVALTSNAIAQDLEAKFDFKAEAAPAKRVLQQLSAKTGVAMSASGNVGEDVLLLNLTEVSLVDTMNKIAQTLNAEWRKEGSGYVLYRGSNLEAADRRAETALRVAEFRKNLKAILDEQKAFGAFNEKTAEKLVDMQEQMNRQAQQASGPIRLSGDFGSVMQQTPSARAISSILSKLSDAQIAALTSSDRTVLSLKPTRMQLPLPSSTLPILQQFVKDTATYQDASRRNEPPAESGTTRRIVVNGFGAENRGDGDPRLGVGYALLINQPNSIGPNTTVSLLVADPNGKLLASGQFFVRPTRPDRSPAQTPPANEKAITLSPLATELAKVLNQLSGGGGQGVVRMVSVAASSSGASTFTINDGGGGTGTPVLSEELKERILNPDKYDPMSFAPGEAFSLAAEAKGRDLVAYLPDLSFSTLNRLMANSTSTPTSFLDAAKTQAGLKLVEDGTWLSVSPLVPATSRDRRVNREALGVALKKLHAKGFLNLDDWAVFATKQVKAPRFSEMDDSYFRMINGPASDAGLSQLDFSGGWPMLQFYASLSNAQKQAMNSSGRIALSSLNQQQMSILHSQVFNSFEGPQVQRDENPRSRTFTLFGPQQDLQSERTYVLPNGVPRDGFLQFRTNQERVVQALSNQQGGGRFLSVDNLAFERIRAERPELARFGSSVQYDQYRLATQSTISFHFQLLPQVSLSRQLTDNSPGSAGFASYDQLPGQFRKQVDEAAERLRQAWGQGGGPGQVPPPATR